MSAGSTKDRAFERLRTGLPTPLASIARERRSAIRGMAQDLEELVRRSAPTWKERGPILDLQTCLLHPNLGVWRGAELPPRFPRLERTDRSLRYVKARDLRMARSPAARRSMGEPVELEAGRAGCPRWGT